MINYPMVGTEEEALGVADDQDSWQISLRLLSAPNSENFRSLLDEVDEVLLSDSVALESPTKVVRTGFCGELPPAGLPPNCWSVAVSPLELKDMDAALETWKLGELTKSVAVLRPDSQILKNVALIERLKNGRRDFDRVVVEAVGNADSDPELLVHQTIQFMSGLLGGAGVLRVSQSEGESFNSVWSRLNILRLLRWEAKMSSSPRCTQGAGLFSELRKQL